MMRRPWLPSIHVGLSGFRPIAVLAAFLGLALIACSPAVQSLEGLDFGDAPDPTYPTALDEAGGGPALSAMNADGEFLAAIILGQCVTVESDPGEGRLDECDDSHPSVDRVGAQFQVDVRRTGAPGEGRYWINVVVDIDGDGRWGPDVDWVVQNCPVDVQGPANDTIQCETNGVGLLSPDSEWMRVMVSDQPAPQAGWDGSAFFSPGGARGEVEDYDMKISYDFGDAPDPSYFTFSNVTPSGAYVARHAPTIGLGKCTTWEKTPNFPDGCDDGDPFWGEGLFIVDVGAASAWQPRPMFVNVVFDVNADGRWHPQDEWVVRNCDVSGFIQPGQVVPVLCPYQGPEEPLANLRPDQVAWMRILLSENQFNDGAGWDGSGDPAGYDFGEVEDYPFRRGDAPERRIPPSPTPTVAPTETPQRPTTQPELTRRYPDAPNDVQEIDNTGQPTGKILQNHEADLADVQMMWITENGERFLEIWVFRFKRLDSFSTSVRLVLLVEKEGQVSSVFFAFWQKHAGQITMEARDAEGSLISEGVVIRVEQNGAEVHFKIPASLVGEATKVFVDSFDLPESGQLRGYDKAEDMAIPPP